MEWIPLNLGHFIEIELYVMYMEIGVDMGISVTPLTSKVLEHSCVRCGQGHCLNECPIPVFTPNRSIFST